MLIRLFIVLILAPSLAIAQNIEDKEKLSINEFNLFIDSSHHYTASTITHLDKEQWQLINSSNINLGYTQASIWLQFELKNTSNQDLARLLDINYPLLDYIDLYEYENNQLKTLISSGDSRLYSERSFRHPNFVASIDLPSKTSKNFYLNIKSNAPIQTEVLLWSADEFQYFYRTKSSLTFLYLGILLSAALFNFVVYFFIKEKSFLVYGLFATSFALLITSQDAILYEYLFQEHPAYHNWSQLILGATTISLTCLFNLLFLNLNKHNNGKILYVMSFIPFIIVISSIFIGYALAIKFLVTSTLLILPVCFAVGVVNSKKHENKNYFLIAWAWLFTGVFIFAMAKLGFIPFNLFTDNSIKMGSALELMTFAIAMAKRLHTEKETRIQAQEIIIDSTKQSAKLQQKLLYNATHNDITGLPNRNLYSQQLDYYCQKKQPCNVVLVRLSRIAELDKTLGRDISNYVLEQVSILLNTYLKESGYVYCLDKQEDFYAANLSNSTFAFITNHEDNVIRSEFFREIIQKINKPILVNELLIDPWITMGYSLHPEHGNHAQLLLRNAGIALDHTSHGNKICAYHNEQDTYNERRLILINELKNAITSNHLQLLYQPLIHTESQNIIGAEALIRWPHQEFGIILPDEFIEIAEQTGIIQALSLWVFKSALHQLKQWIKLDPSFLMSVNISAQNLNDGKFINAISLLISDDLNIAKNIVLEITESQMMTDTKHALNHLWKLNEMGFNIAIDDFGTGYSNLSYLKKLPANELKIDKTFILNLESDKQNQILVQTAIQMAHNLGLSVVAEGVESEKCREILQLMECDMCQGFHFSKPIKPEQFSNLLRK